MTIPSQSLSLASAYCAMSSFHAVHNTWMRNINKLRLPQVNRYRVPKEVLSLLFARLALGYSIPHEVVSNTYHNVLAAVVREPINDKDAEGCLVTLQDDAQDVSQYSTVDEVAEALGLDSSTTGGSMHQFLQLLSDVQCFIRVKCKQVCLAFFFAT